MPKKAKSYRFDSVISIKLDAWNLLLRKDKTQILEEAFNDWESNRPESEKVSANMIIEELKKAQ